MRTNDFRTAIRTLIRQKKLGLINIAGLSIGITACLLVLQYVSFQLSYDQFNKNVTDLYRVYNDRYQEGKKIQHSTLTYSGIGRAMQDDFPEVVDHTRIQLSGENIIAWQNRKIGQQDVLFVDQSFLSMFSYKLLNGDIKKALTEPYTAILSERAAKKIFGLSGNDFSSVTGSLVTIGNGTTPYKITAICEDVPENSHLYFDILASFVSLYSGPHPMKEADYDFTQSNFWQYVQLRHGEDHKALEAKLAAFSQHHFQGNKVSGYEEKFYLQPLSKAHLYSDFEYEIGRTDSAVMVWGLLIIAVLIMIIAWVNYINLATARSAERAKEVGIRKVSGATKVQLVRMFLTEFVVINIIALVTSLVIVALVQDRFNALLQCKLSLASIFQKGSNGYIIPAALIVSVTAGTFIAGAYPAFVLSSFRPVLVLKGRFISSAKGIMLRKALVIGQFTVTVILIIGSFVVYKQIKYMNRQDLGFNISQVLILRPPELTRQDSTFIDRKNSFIEELKQLPGVTAASTSWNRVGSEPGRSSSLRRADQESTVGVTMRQTGFSFGYLNVYQIKLMAGRDFTRNDFNKDFRKIHTLLINESAVKLLNFASSDDAIGKKLQSDDRQWEIVGVISNYHQRSLRYAVEPTIFLPAYGAGSSISIKLSADDIPATIAAIKEKYDAFFPGNLFDYTFADERFNAQYKSERLFGKVFALFSGFAIFIASLGLLGLSLFATLQRTKEIGLRKVLGASVASIVVLLSKDFIKLVLVALVIATPVAYFIMYRWLQNFAYRTPISWWIFIGAGILAVIIAIATISFQTIKAAIADPTKNLRTD